MTIYSHPAGPYDRHRHLHSSIGAGPRGYGIRAEVVSGDPYGFYRIRFVGEDGTVFATTPNLDPGSRIYLCDKYFQQMSTKKYSAGINDFTTEQVGSIRNVRVGDLVIYKCYNSDNVDSLGIGVVNTVSSNGAVSFTSHIELGFDTIATTLTNYITQKSNDLQKVINNYINQAKKDIDYSIAKSEDQIKRIADNAQQQIGKFSEDSHQQINQFVRDGIDEISKYVTTGVFFGLDDYGHVVAHVPTSWEDIEFDTNTDYQSDNYGRLIIRMKNLIEGA